MVTPDFEDWLARQEIPLEDTLTLTRFQRYLQRELGIHGGSLEVAARMYTRRFNILAPLGMRPVELTRIFRGVRVTETRFGIHGRPGLFSILSLSFFISLSTSTRRSGTSLYGRPIALFHPSVNLLNSA